MRSTTRTLFTLVLFLFCSAAQGGPLYVDLEGAMHDLPWVYSGNIIAAGDQGITAVVTETFLGDALPGDTLPARTVTMEVRFAGGSEFIDVIFKERGNEWLSDSRYEPLDDLELELCDLSIGGMDTYPFEPYVTLQLSAGDGMTLTLRGSVDSFEDGIYHCIVYPTGPVILNSGSMRAFLERQQVPESPVIAIEISGAASGELGLAENPYFTTDENGYLRLTGVRGMLDVTGQFLRECGGRPSIGFDTLGTRGNPVYFSFESLLFGPCGHLATDIIDALAKGTVTGSLSGGGDTITARFILSMVRSELQEYPLKKRALPKGRCFKGDYVQYSFSSYEILYSL